MNDDIAEPEPSPLRWLGLGGGSLIAALPLASALVALLWKFPVLMVGTPGGDLNAAWGAAFTAFAYLTLLSMFLGLVLTAALGTGLGWLLRRVRWWWTPLTAFAIALAAAFGVVAVVDHFERGPAWIHVHLGGTGDHQTTLGGHVRDDRPPIADAQVSVRSLNRDEWSSTTTGPQGWATIRVPNGEYEVVTPCGRVTVNLAVDEDRLIRLRC